jgi:UDP-N-acetylmuramoylalanine--D-glutamate ligase
VSFIDDSKGTNVGATIAALRGLDMPCHLIAGGLGKGQDFAPLGLAILERASSVALIGEAAETIAAAVHAAQRETGTCAACTLARFDSLESALRWSAGLATAGEAVLLSPACASLDMFRDYRHRAQVFRESVADFGRARSQAIADA